MWSQEAFSCVQVQEGANHGMNSHYGPLDLCELETCGHECKPIEPNTCGPGFTIFLFLVTVLEQPKTFFFFGLMAEV